MEVQAREDKKADIDSAWVMLVDSPNQLMRPHSEIYIGKMESIAPPLRVQYTTSRTKSERIIIIDRMETWS